MTRLKVYLDECVDHRLAEHLRAMGIDVVTVIDAATTSEDDKAQLLYATDRGRLLLSQNQIDSRRLHATFLGAGRPHGGIVLVPQTRPLQRLERHVTLLLDWIATFPEHSSQLFTWTDLQQRIIHGYRLPGWREDDVRDAIGWS